MSQDTLNGCSFNPAAPLLALATGERRFPPAARRPAGQPSATAREGQQQQLQAQGSCSSSGCSSSSEDEMDADPVSSSRGVVRGMALEPASGEASGSSRGRWQPSGAANLLLGVGLAYTLEEWPTGPDLEVDGAGVATASVSAEAAGATA